MSSADTLATSEPPLEPPANKQCGEKMLLSLMSDILFNQQLQVMFLQKEQKLKYRGMLVKLK